MVVEEGVAKRETRTATGCEKEEQKNPKSTGTLFTQVLQRKAQGENENCRERPREKMSRSRL